MGESLECMTQGQIVKKIRNNERYIIGKYIKNYIRTSGNSQIYDENLITKNNLTVELSRILRKNASGKEDRITCHKIHVQ